MTTKKLQEIAEKNVNEMEKRGEIKLSILYDLSIEKDYGTIFFYNTLKYYQTKDEKENVLISNAPFLVEKETGKIIDFGTARSEEYYIQEYEAGRWPMK
jgi:hypothetical protein